MAKKEKPKEYYIDSLDKLVNLANSENYECFRLASRIAELKDERLSMDFLLWLGNVVNVMDKLRKELPEETKGKANSELMKCSFNWIDDGKNNIHQTVIENGLTGEQTVIDHKQD